jgi:hypothetical protein
MQHRYVGDFGDYVKLGILRALSVDKCLGVAWWLYPDEGHNSDGRHTKYLDDPANWKHFDSYLFEKLQQIKASGKRHISALEQPDILPGAIFADAPIPTAPSVKQRLESRLGWFAMLKCTLARAEIIFVDPDNGLEPAKFSFGKVKAGKAVAYKELLALAEPDRPLIVYHHQTRRKGGHLEEISHLSEVLRDRGFRTVDAIRAAPYSPRVFFILNGSSDLRWRSELLVQEWKGALSWHPHK